MRKEIKNEIWGIIEGFLFFMLFSSLVFRQYEDVVVVLIPLSMILVFRSIQALVMRMKGTQLEGAV